MAHSCRCPPSFSTDKVSEHTRLGSWHAQHISPVYFTNPEGILCPSSWKSSQCCRLFVSLLDSTAWGHIVRKVLWFLGSFFSEARSPVWINCESECRWGVGGLTMSVSLEKSLDQFRFELNVQLQENTGPKMSHSNSHCPVALTSRARLSADPRTVTLSRHFSHDAISPNAGVCKYTIEASCLSMPGSSWIIPCLTPHRWHFRKRIVPRCFQL